MLVLGISAFYHDSAAALLKDGRIVAAAQEERFTRKKHDSDFPTNAVQYRLDAAGITADQLDFVGFYLPALLFSFVFSPNYYEFYDFFETEMLGNLPSTGTVIEIGCGHGLYLSQALRRNAGIHGVGIDIAQAALETARKMMAYHGLGDHRCELLLDDVRGKLRLPDQSAAGVICCEVLEHLPDPAHALAEMKRICAPGAVVLLSAAIRMESVDHLYVFRSHQQVAEMVRGAGLSVVAERVVPLAKGNIRDAAERQRMINDPKIPAGYVCRARPS